MDAHSHRIALSRLAAWLVILAAALPDAPGMLTAAQSDGAASIQLAKSGRSARTRESEDSDVDRDTTAPSVRTFGGAKAPAGGYNPRRIRRFWQNYHGARQRQKSKPLEHEKSFAPSRRK